MALRAQASETHREWTWGRVTLGRLGVGGVALALWEWIGRTQPFGEWISYPSAVVLQIGTWIANGTLGHHAVITLTEIAIGLVMGIPAGILLGLILGASGTIRDMMLPWMMALYTVPIVAVAPLIILWLGVGITSKVFLVAIVTMFILMWNTFAGARDVSQALLNQFKLLGASPMERFLRCTAPAALPWIITGIRIAIPYSLTGAVAGEMIATQGGVGYLIIVSAQRLNMTNMYAALCVLMVFGLAFILIADFLESRLLVARASGARVSVDG